MLDCSWKSQRHSRKPKINVEAICAYAWEELDASFMMVTDDNTTAKKVLPRLGAKVEVEDVIALEVPNKVGELNKATKKIAFAGIDIYCRRKPCERENDPYSQDGERQEGLESALKMKRVKPRPEAVLFRKKERWEGER